MALDQSALLELLDALKAADGVDVVRSAVQMMLQALIDAEATAVIGAGPHERTGARTAQRNGSPDADAVDDGRGSGAADPQAAGRVVLPVAAGAAAADRSGAVRGGDGGLPARHVRPARSTTWSRPWARTPGSPSPRSPGSARTSTTRSRRSGTGPWPSSAFPYVFLDATYCKARIGSEPCRVPGRLPGRRDRHRRQPPTGAGRSSASTSATARTARSGPRSCAR